jgi:hypothetical protein
MRDKVADHIAFYARELAFGEHLEVVRGEVGYFFREVLELRFISYANHKGRVRGTHQGIVQRFHHALELPRIEVGGGGTGDIDVFDDGGEAAGNGEMLLELGGEIELLVEEGEEDGFFRVVVPNDRGLDS